MKKLWSSPLFWVLVLVACGVAGFWYYRGGGEDDQPKYRTDAVSRGPISETVTATGTISAVTTVQVGSQVSGIIARLYADFNSPVRKGQLVAELDPTPYEAQVEQRRADLVRNEVQMRSAEIDFRRSGRLLEEGLTSQAEFDVAQANLDGARAQVDQARAALRQSETNLRYTKILSPIDGVVVARQYDIGQTVAASFQAPTLFTIAQDLKKMEVQADVDQADIGKIRVGQKARFTVDAYPDEDFEGEISQVRLNATVNQNVISYPVILAVPNPEEKLRPQMTANVTIVVSSIGDVLRIPNAALRFRPVQTGEAGKGGSAPTPADDAKTRRGPAGRPPGGAQAGTERSPEEKLAEVGRRPGLEGAASTLGAGAPRGARRPQTIYLLEAKGDLKPVQVRTGITDGRFTAILEGDLEEGDKVAVGLATSKVESTGSFPGSTGPPGVGGRSPGGGRRAM